MCKHSLLIFILTFNFIAEVRACDPTIERPPRKSKMNNVEFSKVELSYSTGNVDICGVKAIGMTLEDCIIRYDNIFNMFATYQLYLFPKY